VPFRLWRSFDLDTFLTDLQASALCDDQQYQHLDGDALAQLYDTTVGELLDVQIPVRRVTCRQRPSCTWFDDECRTAKRALRATERTARRAGQLSDISTPTAVAWRAQRRQYIALLHQKRSTFWTERINAEQSHPSRLWRSFDELLGRGRAPSSTDITASDLHRYFDEKVAGVRASTAGADSPTFTPAPVGCVLRVFTVHRSHSMT